MTNESVREIPATGELNLPPHLCKPRLRRFEVPEYMELVHGVPVAQKTLEKLASVGGGPAFVKFGNRVLYPRDALDAWAAHKTSKLLKSTSELSAE